jgi:hypothetical protein
MLSMSRVAASKSTVCFVFTSYHWLMSAFIYRHGRYCTSVQDAYVFFVFFVFFIQKRPLSTFQGTTILWGGVLHCLDIIMVCMHHKMCTLVRPSVVVILLFSHLISLLYLYQKINSINTTCVEILYCHCNKWVWRWFPHRSCMVDESERRAAPGLSREGGSEPGSPETAARRLSELKPAGLTNKLVVAEFCPAKASYVCRSSHDVLSLLSQLM